MNRHLTSALLLALAWAGQVYAVPACTYGEALQALERGNTARGSMLMKMAAADGDVRARRYLASPQKEAVKLAAVSKDGRQGERAH